MPSLPLPTDMLVELGACCDCGAARFGSIVGACCFAGVVMFGVFGVVIRRFVSPGVDSFKQRNAAGLFWVHSGEA